MAFTDHYIQMDKGSCSVGWFALILCYSPLALTQGLSIDSGPNNIITITAKGSEDFGFQLESSTDGIEWIRASDHAVGHHVFPLSTESQSHAMYRLRVWELPWDPIRLVIIGDSTIANFNVVYGNSGGWGQAIPDLFTQDITIANQAQPGVSTKVFMETPIFLHNLLLSKPDFVLLHFGYMDAHSQRDHIRTTPEEFRENITILVEEIRNIGGTPILCTPVTTTAFTREKLRPLLSTHSETIRQLAIELGCSLMDVYEVSFKLFQELGPQGTLQYQGGENDQLHFNEAGAKAVAALTAPLFPPFLKAYQRESKSSQ